MNREETKYLAAQIFKDAADYIRKYGWRVSGMSEHGKPRCSMGALDSAYSKKKWESKLSELMYSTLYKQLNGLTLTEFNYRYKSGLKVAELFEQVALNLKTR